ncbi:MAG: hypothetical protein WB760_03465 [Xanthobacteraceae bacterium]
MEHAHAVFQFVADEQLEWYARLQERPAFKATYFPGSRVSDFLKLEPLYAAERG